MPNAHPILIYCAISISIVHVFYVLVVIEPNTDLEHGHKTFFSNVNSIRTEGIFPHIHTPPAQVTIN